MKKAISAGLLATLPIAAAHAQSSVTLFGQIDAGLAYVSDVGGSHAFMAASGSTQSTRWGLRGTEDISGGTSVVFQFRNSFSIVNGSQWPSGSMWGSQAQIGLTNRQWGTLLMGRMIDPMGDYLWAFSSGGDWGGSHFAHPYDNDNIWGAFLVNNAVKYRSPEYHGLSVGGTYAFSNKSSPSSGDGSGFADNRMWGAGARYTNGSLRIALAYEHLDNPGDDVTGGTRGAIDTDDANFTTRSQSLFGAGVLYNFTKVTLGANITRTTLDQPTSLWSNVEFTGANSLAFTNYEINAVYHITPMFDLSGAYTYTRATVSGKAPHWNQIGVIANYALSKRTSLYAAGIYQRLHSDGSQFANAEINNFSEAAGDRQTAVLLGIKHNF
ncbi:porin [Paraburkholderia sp. XV]|uniref:porin n=1 Tax=Paraburkholderia sp. XV TaxID=2831520 RepID=UPI001CD45DDF|nr:porin [Paraburkholderia sp. XV]